MLISWQPNIGGQSVNIVTIFFASAKTVSRTQCKQGGWITSPTSNISVVMQANLMGVIKSPAPAWQLISCRGQAGISFLFQSCTLSKSSFMLVPRISKCFAFLIALLHAPVKSGDERWRYRQRSGGETEARGGGSLLGTREAAAVRLGVRRAEHPRNLLPGFLWVCWTCASFSAVCAFNALKSWLSAGLKWCLYVYISVQSLTGENISFSSGNFNLFIFVFHHSIPLISEQNGLYMCFFSLYGKALCSEIASGVGRGWGRELVQLRKWHAAVSLQGKLVNLLCGFTFSGCTLKQLHRLWFLYLDVQLKSWPCHVKAEEILSVLRQALVQRRDRRCPDKTVTY